jgi:hypothetical protein
MVVGTPEWRNGRRAALKMPCPSGRVGSTPTSGIASAAIDKRRESGMEKGASEKGKSPSQLIDERIKELGDWRGEMLGRLRALVKEADPEVVEEWKWVKATNPGTPVWSHDGIICTGETYKNVVKMTFAKGASLEDPSGIFNSSLGGNTRRAIDFHEGDEVDEDGLKALVRAAVALNESKDQS